MSRSVISRQARSVCSVIICFLYTVTLVFPADVLAADSPNRSPVSRVGEKVSVAERAAKTDGNASPVNSSSKIKSRSIKNSELQSTDSSARLIHEQKDTVRSLSSESTNVSVDELLGREPSVDEILRPEESEPVVKMLSASTGASPDFPQAAVNHVHFDPSNGSGVISLPITTPPGRCWLKPNITLSYSPRGGNGSFGTGWNMDFGFIERSTKNGVPSFDNDADTFIAVIDGMNMELVKISEGRYRAKVEGAFYNFQYDGTYWLARNGKGVTYYFGRDDLYNDQSRQGASGKTFRWRLSKAVDTLGNYYLIKYLPDNAFEIFWTGEPGTDNLGVNTAVQNFFARVEAVLETAPRLDSVVSRRGGFEEKISRRIKEVKVYAVNQLQRKYVFDYDYSFRSGRSLLKKITEYGADGVSVMPAVMFDYEEEPVNYSIVGATGNPVQGDNLWAFRHNGGYDRGHCNYGPVPPSHMLPFSPVIVASSWDVNGGRWVQDQFGRIEIWGRQDTGYYFYTYLYTSQPIALNFAYQAAHWNAYFAVNGVRQYSQTWQLKKGYNLLEYTDYHQHHGFWGKFLTTFTDKVQLMNSVQLILPQLAGDFNGDGLSDVATYFAKDGNIKVALSNGGVLLPKETWLSGIASNTQVLIGDINADGKTDAVLFNPSTGNWDIAFSNGTNFTAGTRWLSGFGAGQQATLADINGDGRLDAVRIFDDAGKKKVQVAMNTGNSFQVHSAVSIIGDSTSVQVFAADINGDGLSDFGSFDSATGNWKFIINKRGTPDSIGSEGGDVLTISNFGASKQMVVADLNGDGITDAGYFDQMTGEVKYRVSRSSSFSPDTLSIPVQFNLTGSDVQLQTSDFNGDGISDFIVYNSVGNIEFAYSGGKTGDLLTRIDNGIGGVTTLAYTPSIAFNNSYLPFIMPLVTAVTVSNSRDTEITTRYEYEGGLWKPEDREFYGFKKVRVIDELGRKTETEFAQNDVYDRGKILKSISYDSQGYPVGRTRHEQWKTVEMFPGQGLPIKMKFAEFIQDARYRENGQDGIEIQRRTVDDSPANGAAAYLPAAEFFGRVGFNTTGPINKEEEYRFERPTLISNTDDNVWLVNIPKKSCRYEKIPSVLTAQTDFYYDNADSIDAPPVNGLVTKKVVIDVLDQGNDQTFLYAYDQYGNPEQSTDPRGKTSSLIYDADFHLFPVAEINPLNQSVSKEYYGIEGVPLSADGYHGLFGQLKSVTDANGVSESYVYDNFGRLVKVIGSRDSLALPTVLYQYQISADHVIKISSKRLDHGIERTVDTAQVVDGLGRAIQAKTNSGQDGKFIVAGKKEFDAVGRVIKEYVPHSVTTLLAEIDSVPVSLAYSFYEYDDQNRVVKQINPDGTYASFDYDLVVDDGTSKSSTIDPNGHQKISYTDIHGRVFKIEEYQGADGRSELYPQENYQLYAATQYRYGSRDQLEKVIDAHGNQTVITYDGLGRKKGMDDPDMGYWEYGYDKNGNMTWQIDARGRRLDFTYDALNRLVNKTDGADIDVTYTYDINPDQYGIGRLGQVEYGSLSGNDLTRFFYDEFGREIQSLKVIDGIGYYIGRDYDAMNNLKSVQYPDGNSVYYHYDEAGRLNGVANDPVMFENEAGGEPLSKAEPDDGIWGNLKNFYSDWFEPYVLGISPAYASASAELISPEPSSILTDGKVTFEWTPGEGVEQYVLYVGTQTAGSDIYNGWEGLNFSATVDIPLEKFGMPIVGRPVYVRLWSYLGTAWMYQDYVFQTQESPFVDVNSCQVLHQSGKTYLLTRNLSGAEVTANCMNITAPDVTLDCQGHSITNHDLKSSLINSNQNGTVVKGCILEAYLGSGYADYNVSHGIFMTGSNGVFRNNVIRHAGSGIYAGGNNNMVQNNIVENTIKAIRFRNDNNTAKNNLTKNNKNAQGWGLEVWKGTGNQFINNKSSGNDYGMILSYADETLVRCNQLAGNSAKDLYLYNGSNNVMLEGSRPAKHYVSGDSDMTVNAKACMDMECVWDGDICIPNPNQLPHFEMPEKESVLSDQAMRMSIVVTDADQDVLAFVSDKNVLPRGAQLTTVSSEAGRLEAELSWTPQRADIGDHNIVLAVTDGQTHATDEITIHVARGVIVEDPKLYVSGIEYNEMGQMKKIVYGTGTAKEYFYDEVTFRLERMVTVNGAGIIIQDLNYQYDNAGNIVAVTDNVNTATQAFSYDHLNRLVMANGDLTYGEKIYRYDEVGNILEKDGNIFAYGENGAGPHAVTSLSDGAAFGYDDNGNMVSHQSARGNFVYHFDAENRLSLVEKTGASSVDFRYDGDGGRTKKVAYGVVSGIPVSGMAYPELLQDGAGENDLVTHFIGSLYEVDNLHEVKHVYLGSERILSVRDGEEQYIHSDHLGSSNVVEDQHGELVQINEYQPFGGFSRRDKLTVNGQESDLYFTQQILDDETGLYYYGARYYDPMLGRFISADPTVMHPNDPQDLNRYAYCRNNPINLVDPTGLGWLKDFFKWANDIIEDGVDWLEKATGSEWVIEAEFGYSYQTNQPVYEPATITIQTAAFIPLGFYSFWNDGISGRNPNRSRASWEDIWYSFDLRVLGIGTTDEKAQRDAEKNNAVALYVKSRGILADFVRAGLKKFFGGGKAGSELADHIRNFEGRNIYAHSEGTLTLSGAIRELNRDNFRFGQEVEIKWNGPVIMKSTADTLSRSIDADSKYRLNFGDPIGVFTTPDPVKIGIYGAIGTATGFKFHGTDYYDY